MRSALPIAAAGLAALAALPAPARAMLWGGQVGLDYQRLDTETATGRASFPRLDLSLRLDASGDVPDLMSWSGGAAYRRLAASQDGFDTVRDDVTYQLRSSLFTHPRSAVNVDLSATRSNQSDSTEGVSATQYHLSTYAGELRLNAVERPFLIAGYSFSGSTSENPLLGTIDRSIETFSGTLGHGSSSYTYRGSYRLNRSDGTFALDKYDDHRVDVLTDARIADAATLSLSDTYYLRTPRDESTPSPRAESNNLLATVRAYGTGQNAQTLTYGYARGVRTFPGVPDIERTGHSLGYAIDRGVSETEFRFRGTLQLSYVDDRIGDAAVRTGGESLTVLSFWTHDEKGGSRTELHAGPTVALLHPGQGDTRSGWGGTAGGYLSRNVGAVQTFASYDFGYASNVNAEAGWTIVQTAMGTASGRLALGTLRGSLQLSAQRRNSPEFGGSASRSITLTSSYAWAASELSLQASLQDGADGTVQGAKDGLFLPPGYDTHFRSAVLGAATSPWTFLILRARLRYVLTELPDRPSLDEKEIYGGVEYVYGALRIGIEDRFVFAGTEGGQTRYNQVFVRVYRAFGARL
jgi:hypothetical protein